MYHMFLILHKVAGCSAITIEKLQRTYATFGLPEAVVSDNGLSFTSHELQSS